MADEERDDVPCVDLTDPRGGAGPVHGVRPGQRTKRFAAALPSIIADARQAVARRRADPGDDLISDLLQGQAEDGDRLSDTEIVTLA